MIALLRLKEAGRRVVLISLDSEPVPPGLGALLTYHVPSNSLAFQKEDSLNTDATAAALGALPASDTAELTLKPVNKRS